MLIASRFRVPKQGISHYHETFGEALLGVELQPSGLNIDFQGAFLVLTFHGVRLVPAFR